ncbi:hypothetical protein [Roseimicrobium gellanilyticum]|uniref:hypothetical protein n=1 Tax=Roseimicrobium gellanilyticum TaxID=748857 RepID=UPI0014757EF4|nr:hypothetical protein [Roseimicrobium gellanilyticum]
MCIQNNSMASHKIVRRFRTTTARVASVPFSAAKDFEYARGSSHHDSAHLPGHWGPGTGELGFKNIEQEENVGRQCYHGHEWHQFFGEKEIRVIGQHHQHFLHDLEIEVESNLPRSQDNGRQQGGCHKGEHEFKRGRTQEKPGRLDDR